MRKGNGKDFFLSFYYYEVNMNTIETKQLESIDMILRNLKNNSDFYNHGTTEQSYIESEQRSEKWLNMVNRPNDYVFTYLFCNDCKTNWKEEKDDKL